MKIISLFSGAGGLDLGLIQAGNEVIWANDIDKDAVATYRENIGDSLVKDFLLQIERELWKMNVISYTSFFIVQ